MLQPLVTLGMEKNGSPWPFPTEGQECRESGPSISGWSGADVGPDLPLNLIAPSGSSMLIPDTEDQGSDRPFTTHSGHARP